MSSAENTDDEMKSWLKILLKNENVEILDYEILGNTEKGDGYMGDVVFVEVSGATKEGNMQKYSLVLKCAKKSLAFRKKSPIKQAFLNEIYFYETVFPSFMQFQQEREVDEPFEKIPKCYGTMITTNMEVIALENLKSKSYVLWERTKPLTRQHIDMVIEEYGKFHAVSIAMKKQEPERFEELAGGLDDLYLRLTETTQIISSYEDVIEELPDLLKDDFDEDLLTRWLNLKQKVRPLFTERSCSEGLRIITHGDCWSNNFMYQQINNKPSTFAILDWQLARYYSPILDLSYFLFSCLSEEDMDDMDGILRHYHTSLTSHLRKLGSDAGSLYPFDQFLDEWKKYAHFGLIMGTAIHKFSLLEKDEVTDMVEAAERGQDIATVFSQPMKNIGVYKKRMKYIVKHVAENNLI